MSEAPRIPRPRRPVTIWTVLLVVYLGALAVALGIGLAATIGHIVSIVAGWHTAPHVACTSTPTVWRDRSHSGRNTRSASDC